MTPEREAEAREVAAHGTWDPMTGEYLVRDLLAEIDRLRALPVLRTCGDCRWCEPVSWPPSPSCQHPRTLAAHQIGYMPVNVDATPPATCPLRGAQ